jgi:hypothetical protein
VRAPGAPTTATVRKKTAPGIYRAQDAERVANRPGSRASCARATGQYAGRRHRLRRIGSSGGFLADYPPFSHLISENIRG